MINLVATNIVEAFEDLLERHDIIIPDEDRPDENDTPIFGCAYGDLVDRVESIIIDSLENSYYRLRDRLTDIINEREGISDSNLSSEELDELYCSAVLKMDAVKCAIDVFQNNETRIL